MDNKTYKKLRYRSLRATTTKISIHSSHVFAFVVLVLLWRIKNLYLIVLHNEQQQQQQQRERLREWEKQQ